MRKKAAINALECQRDKLDSSWADKIWFTQTLSYLESIFGKPSQEHSAVSTYYMMHLKHPEFYNPDKEELIRLLNDSIETIKTIGIKVAQPNFISRLNNATLLGIIIFAVPSLLAIGSLWGKYLSDVQNFELKQENRKLKDSINSLLIRPLTQDPNTKSDKTADDTSQH